ncbi:MAG: DNA gyrase subunit A [Gammaproteobacteria bacterium]|nr:DNA gyrase subunit A [Gammaproteobacteria bacterium]
MANDEEKKYTIEDETENTETEVDEEQENSEESSNEEVEEVTFSEEDLKNGHHSGGVREVDLAKEMKTSFLSYAMSVIVSRAIPDVRDGMKPVHRRIMYGMNELGVYCDKPFKKSARIVGDVMGKYHPHGDTAIYESMVRMAQDFSYRYQLVDGHGNFGSVDGDGAAAMRYTEARMSKIAMELLRDLNKNTVNFIDNYDGSEQEPEVLPSKFPNILVNGAMGIAVGMATSIPPHNLTEVIEGLLALIKNPDISIEGLMTYVKGPDFPTGGIIMGLSQVRKAYLTGSGTITIRAKCEIKELEKGKSSIIVTEIPYQVNKRRLIERIAETVKDKLIDGITNIQDESSMKGMRVVIDLRRDVNPNVILNQLYKHTQLQFNFGINTLVLVKGQPRVLNLKEVLQYYLEHQIEVITRRTQYDLDKAKARAHIVEGLLVALADIDAVVKLIKESRTTEAAQEGLMREFHLSDLQAKAILDMKLQKIASLEVDKLKEEYAELKKLINALDEILKSHAKKLEIIVQELQSVKERFGDDRRSEISLSDELEIEDEDLIPVEDVIITVTNKGYVKRMTVDTYRVQNRGGKGITGAKMVDEDFIERVIYTSSHDTLLFFSNLGKIYKLKAYQIPYASRTAKGLPIVNLLNFEEKEKLAAVLNVNEKEDTEGFLIFATRQGIIKKTEVSAFQNIRTNGIKAILLNDGDELFKVALTDGEKDIILGTSSGKAIRFSESDIRPMGRISAGVRGIKVEDGYQVVGMAVVNTDGDEIVIVTDKGYGKRTNVDAFRVQVRGGKGVKALNLTAKNGNLASLLTVRGDEDLMVVTDKGMIIRTHLDQILTIGRDTQGVRIIMLNEGQKVANIAIVPRSEENDEQNGDEIFDDEYELDLDYQFIDENNENKNNE